MIRRLLLIAALLPFAAGCVATKQDVEELRLDMAAQRAQQDSLFRTLIARTEAMLDSLSDQNVRLRGDFANRLVAIERQLVQIQELSGQNQAQLAGLRQQIEQSAAEARRAQEAAAASARDDVEGGGEEEGGDPQELYDAALGALRRGSVGTARTGFEEFLRANPQHRLAADAQYNIGQSYEQGREAANAIEAYGRVVELYPTSGRAPAALLRMGRLELARGNRTEARSRFNAMGATFDCTPWGDAEFEAVIRHYRPGYAFGLLGTTRSRARRGRPGRTTRSSTRCRARSSSTTSRTPSSWGSTTWTPPRSRSAGGCCGRRASRSATKKVVEFPSMKVSWRRHSRAITAGIGETGASPT